MLELVAPLDGCVVPIEAVPDPVFSQKMVGNGVAIDPTSQVLKAPCAGKIIHLHSAHHALTIQTPDGSQILLHIGLDTVQLKGQGFKPKVKIGDQVTAGQELIEFDADLLSLKAKSLLSLMVVTGDTPIQITFHPGLVKGGQDVLIQIHEGGETQVSTSTPATTSAASAPVTVRLSSGLHARPAAQIVSLAKKFKANIEIKSSAKTANAKSVVSILAMEIGSGQTVIFQAEGSDAQAAVAELSKALASMTEPKGFEAHSPAPAIAKPSKAGSLLGVAVSPGLAIGRIHQVRQTQLSIIETPEGQPNLELNLLSEAIRIGQTELDELLNKTIGKTDPARAAIFASHKELLDDPDILGEAQQIIATGKSAAFAWNQAIETHATRLANLNNELMAGRANDLRDVGRRVLKKLTKSASVHEAFEPAGFGKDIILVAENLTPSETAQLNRDRISGFCTTTGGATSHVAILARALGLPAIAGMDAAILQIPEGTEVILNGDTGEIRLHPTPLEKSETGQRQEDQLHKRQLALSEAHTPAITKSGQWIEVAANIGSVADAEQAVAMGADGVGLLRSEFLFLERTEAPSEEEQWQIYQRIADTLGARPLVIRTLDVGGDKPLQYLPLDPEDNPFLGIRGIRVGLRHPEILRAQLRAILRVRSAGKIHVMFPMIATLEEFREAKVILEDERRKLNAPLVSVGVMIEVPSAALMADQLAPEVDFFSIGTNDLTQYTLAMDRGHKDLAKEADAMHPSVLRLIDMTCRAAKAHGKWVGVCGGLAGDERAVPILIGLGVHELSVSIPVVPLIKSQVRQTDAQSTLSAIHFVRETHANT